MTSKTFLLLFLPVLVLLLGTCRRKPVSGFEYDKAGFYYKLLAFDEMGQRLQAGQVARVSVAFKTQSDSLFWDSYNNLNDNFFVRTDSAGPNNLFARCITRYALHDSVCMLLPPSEFFRQQFGTTDVPFFCQGDTVVKVYFKIRSVLSESEFARIRQNLEDMEMQRIETYYGSRQQVLHARDSLGFYWVDRPQEEGQEFVAPGDVVNITCQGYFLNGRLLEKSPQNFDVVYGAPDQVLKGINYVIQRLKVGQNAKIILPSRLAFGEKGSSNGTVPPFTALVYEIKINGIKK